MEKRRVLTRTLCMIVLWTILFGLIAFLNYVANLTPNEIEPCMVAIGLIAYLVGLGIIVFLNVTGWQ